MLPQIWSVTENFVILDHFFHFDPLITQKIKILKKWKKAPGDVIILHMCTINDNMIMAPEMWSATDNFLSCPFTPQQPIKSKFRKNLKNGGDITILHMCTINVNHMMYSSWDMKHNAQNFWSFWAIFYPFNHQTTHKMKTLKKWKKTPEDTIILHMFTIHDIHMYGSWDMKYDRQNLMWFWVIFALLPH